MTVFLECQSFQLGHMDEGCMARDVCVLWVSLCLLCVAALSSCIYMCCRVSASRNSSWVWGSPYFRCMAVAGAAAKGMHSTFGAVFGCVVTLHMFGGVPQEVLQRRAHQISGACSGQPIQKPIYR